MLDFYLVSSAEQGSKTTVNKKELPLPSLLSTQTLDSIGH